MRYAYACSHICLRSRTETAPEAVRLVRQTQLSNTFVFDCKQFSEIPIVREHKRALVVWPSEITL